MNTIRPQDYNGFTPDENSSGRPEQPGEVCACCLEEDPYYQLGYERGRADLMMAILKHANDNLTEALARLERPAA